MSARLVSGGGGTCQRSILQPVCKTQVAARPVARNVAARARESSPKHEELLSALQELDTDALSAWAASNTDSLTLGFLAWVAEQETMAAGEERRQLWELGSTLMALREGLAPVSMDRLQQELKAASAAGQATAASDRAASRAGGQRHGDRLASAPAGLAAAAQRSVALGLSAEGMALFQQQAAALEAVIGTSRAKALTAVIGRKRVGSPQEAHRVLGSDAAGRILEVLLSITGRQDRAAMLPEAFTPPAGPTEGYYNGSTAEEEEEEEEELSTTPLQLLQAIDLWQARLQRQRGAGDAAAPAKLLPGQGLGLSTAQLQQALRELREDVQAYWEGATSDTF